MLFLPLFPLVAIAFAPLYSAPLSLSRFYFLPFFSKIFLSHPNLSSFIIIPPQNLLTTVERIVNMGFLVV
jgi:hypothetical protein